MSWFENKEVAVLALTQVQREADARVKFADVCGWPKWQAFVVRTKARALQVLVTYVPYGPPVVGLHADIPRQCQGLIGAGIGQVLLVELGRYAL